MSEDEIDDVSLPTRPVRSDAVNLCDSNAAASMVHTPSVSVACCCVTPASARTKLRVLLHTNAAWIARVTASLIAMLDASSSRFRLAASMSRRRSIAGRGAGQAKYGRSSLDSRSSSSAKEGCLLRCSPSCRSSMATNEVQGVTMPYLENRSHNVCYIGGKRRTRDS